MNETRPARRTRSRPLSLGIIGAGIGIAAICGALLAAGSPHSAAPSDRAAAATRVAAGSSVQPTGPADTPRPSPTAQAACAADQGAPATSGQTDTLIAQYTAALKAKPGDHDSLLFLGLAYYQHARETADPTDYARADQAFKTILATTPDDVEALIGQATLALGRHQFSDALAIGQHALSLDTHIARIYGVIGDAQNELGHYDDAVTAVQTMVQTRPDLSSYSRVSYVRELHGDLDGAISAMETAVLAGGPAPENTSYLRVILGNLWFQKGNLEKADGAYRTALQGSPGYVFALAGVARVAAARGDLQQAIACYRVAADRVPFPEFIVALGETQQAAGEGTEADRTYALVRQVEALFTANGVNTDLDLALFEAEHGDPATALTLAQTAYSATPNIKAADALAWAEYKNGQLIDARKHAEEALRLGTLDPSYAYHAGMIAKAQGDTAAARAWLQQSLGPNPQWSPLHAPRAQAALEAVGSAPSATP